jgi:hypothetical protein
MAVPQRDPELAGPRQEDLGLLEVALAGAQRGREFEQQSREVAAGPRSGGEVMLRRAERLPREVDSPRVWGLTPLPAFS